MWQSIIILEWQIHAPDNFLGTWHTKFI
jgi:hypothetical protein